jgi:uncharacterized protein
MRQRAIMLSRRAVIAGLLAAPVMSRAFAQQRDWSAALIAAAEAQVGVTTIYDPAYVTLRYPGGDVPAERGVCTDVVIRAYRALGFDLQKAVHEDMRKAFAAYPTRWGLKRPDRNIDHRRVENLRVFFRRRGGELPIPTDWSDWQPGDLFTQLLPGNLPHIGLCSADRAENGEPLGLHNIGGGAQKEQVLSAYELTGRYRFAPEG